MPTIRYRRAALVGALAVTVACGLAACGTGTQGTGSATEGTVRVQTATGPTADAMKRVADDFEKANPGVTVELESLDANASRSPNAALLSSSTAPDVGYLQRSTGVWSTLIKNHELLSLDDVWKASKLADKYAQSQVDYYTTDGHHYGVLYDELLINPVYYNVDAFTKAGIARPKDHRFASVAELEEAAAKLKSIGMGGLGVGGSSPFGLGHTLDALLPTAVSADDYATMLTNFRPGAPGGDVTYTQPGVVKMLQLMRDWETKGLYQDGMLGMDDSKAAALFTGGSIGMVQGGTYSWANISAAKPSFAIDWALMPSLTPGRTTPFDAFNGDTLVVPKHATHPELAKKFIEFFMTDKYQSTVIPESGSLPVFQNLDASKLTGLGKPVRQMLEASARDGVVNIWDSTVPTSLGQAFSVPVLQQVVAGTITPEQGAQKFQDALEALRSGKAPSDTD